MGLERRYTKVAELAVQPDLDSVLVLNSDKYHADHTIAALRNGKHVLVEKPMCLTLREADEIITGPRRCRRAGDGWPICVASRRGLSRR